ncbi:MAG: hypothetical protein HUK23_06985 [Sphaerochaetaceae bacterium]|nr:hypothetical protein [Sphaerochaetaceae bacterium]
MTALFSSYYTGLPIWYYSPEAGTGFGWAGLVGEGHASTQRQAELLAYSNIISILSEKIGYDLGVEAYREISVLGTISKIGLTVEDKYTLNADNGYTVYLHAVINEDLLQEAMSDELKRNAELAAQVESLVLEGDNYIKAGQELKAIRLYLEAMNLSYGSDFIDKDYSFDELYKVVYDLIERMNMAIVSSKKSSANCTISLTRVGSFASSAVTSAEVLAVFMAEDTKGNRYEDSFVCVTGSDGQFLFNPINNSIVRTGTVVFKLYLDKELSVLEKNTDSARIKNLKQLIDSKSVSFEYSRVYKYSDIAVTVIEHDNIGNVTGLTEASNYLVSKLINAGAFASIYYPSYDNEDDVLDEFQATNRNDSCLLIIRVGIIDKVESKLGKVAVNVEGIATLYDVKTSGLLYQSDIIYANAFESTYEEAVKAANKNLIDIAYSLVKAVYV